MWIPKETPRSVRGRPQDVRRDGRCRVRPYRGRTRRSRVDRSSPVPASARAPTRPSDAAGWPSSCVTSRTSPSQRVPTRGVEGGVERRPENARGTFSDLSEKAPDLVFRWWRGQDLNLRPSGYEPDELPDCSTPRRAGNPTVAPLLAPTRMSVAGRPGGTPLGLVSVATRRGSRPRAGRRGRRRPAWPPSCRSAGERGWGCSGRRSGRPCAGPRPR